MTIDWGNMSPGENKVFLPGAAGKVEAILHLPKDDKDIEIKAIMICCHPHPVYGGTMTNKVVHTVCKTFSKMGVPSLRFNFRGVGQSDGSYDAGVGESEDLLIIARLMQEHWPEQELWLSGFSFGSWIATQCAVELEASQLLTIAPPIGRFDFETYTLPSCPWFVLMGDADDVVDPKTVFDWIDNQENPPELEKFEGTGHFFHGQIFNMSEILQKHYLPLL